jgi:uncharacterized protein (TIGR02270 family)
LAAIGELGRRDLRHALRSAFDDEDESCRFAAAWSAALFGDANAAPVLRSLAATSAEHGARACEMLARITSIAEAKHTIHGLAGEGDIALRSAIAGAGALGDPSLMPWLIALTRDAEQGRLAAWSIAQIGDANVAEELCGKPPPDRRAGPSEDPEDDDVAGDRDEDLPWPDPDRLATLRHASAAPRLASSFW